MKVLHLDAQTSASIVSEKATGLSAHFVRIRDGSMPTRPTPFFRSLSDEQLKAKVERILNQARSKYERLVAYEETRWSKFGPQGGYPPLDDRWEDLMAYYSPNKHKCTVRKRPDYDKLIEQTRKRIFGNTHSLRPLTFEDALARDIREDKVNSNSGLPDYQNRSNLEVQQKALDDAKTGRWRTYPYILGSRSSRLKPRFIFMSPMSANINGKRYLYPIMDAIRAQKNPFFSAWEGFDEVEQGFQAQNCFTAKFKWSMDYTKMDTTMKLDQMRIVYDIIAPVFQPRHRADLWDSMSHACTADVMFADNKIIRASDHGILSGTEWTNPSESIMSEFVHSLMDASFGLQGNQGQGDDGAGSSNADSEDEIAQGIEQSSEECGLTASAEKQDTDAHTLHYLQRFFDDTIFIEGTNVVAGSYPLVLAVNTARYPERFHDPDKWSGTMEILRWIMILENMKHSPYFHEAVDLFVEGDAKYHMGLSIPGFFKRVLPRDYKVAKTIRGFVPTYNQASRDKGINDFETVKYLKQLKRR